MECAPTRIIQRDGNAQCLAGRCGYSDRRMGSAQRRKRRQGRTIRMTAPYGSELGSLAAHHAARPDDVVNKAITRTLYNGIPRSKLCSSSQSR